MKIVLFSISIVLSQFVSQAVFAEPSAARQNELIYFVKQDCGSCHGMTLKGGLGPALLPQRLSAQPKEYLVNTIMEGRENTAMPPWKSMLSLDDANWIVEQLQQGIGEKTQLTQTNKTVSQP